MMWTAPPGWYDDPYRVAQHRWWDGARWTQAAAGLGTGGQHTTRAEHPTLPLAAAIGAFVAVAVPVFASKFALRALSDQRWPIAVYVALAGLLGYGPALLWCRFASRRWGSGSVRRDAGVEGRWVDLGWGVVTWLACLVTQIAIGIVIVLTQLPTARNTEGIAERSGDRAYVISLLVLAVVAAPIVEEVVFRGFVMRGLLSRMSATAAVAAQGVLFGAVHADPVRGMGNIGLVVILSGVGATLGGAAYLFRRIAPTMLAHAVLNAVALALVLSGVADRFQ